MNLLQQYDFDSLPLIDREYDDPAVKDIVKATVAAEMQTFEPQNYLEYLPYPSLNFSNSPALKEEYERIAAGRSATKFDTAKYVVVEPEGGLQQDSQAWRKCVANAKTQYEHTQNRMMNIELALEHSAPLWLQQNCFLEAATKGYAEETTKHRTAMMMINSERQRMQQQVYSELSKLKGKRDASIQRTLQCRQGHEQVVTQLTASGCLLSLNQYKDELRKEEEERQLAILEVNDASRNSTVREYETVNESTTTADEFVTLADGHTGEVAGKSITVTKRSVSSIGYTEDCTKSKRTKTA